MPDQPMVSAPAFQPLAFAGADVGTWRCSLVEGRMRCDAVMAEIYGLTEEEGERGVPFARVRAIIHPEDRHLFDRKNERVREAGGFIVSEYRIVPRPGLVRWVLVRGRYEPRQPGSVEVTGHGIVIDITSSKTNGRDDAGRFYASVVLRDEPRDALDGAAEAAIALRAAVMRLGEDEIPGLEAATAIVLQLIGRELAGRTIPDDLN